MTTDYEKLLAALTDARVDFVVVGAVALVLHGSPRVTRDLDVCYARTKGNFVQLASALAPLAPSLRGAPPSLPFRLDAATLRAGVNFTLTTTAGDIDLLGEITGLGGFTAVQRLSESMTVYGRDIPVLGLAGLERAKRAAGRLKDLADLAEIAELRRLRGERG